MIPNSLDDWVIVIMVVILVYGACVTRLEQMKQQTKEEQNGKANKTEKSK